MDVPPNKDFCIYEYVLTPRIPKTVMITPTTDNQAGIQVISVLFHIETLYASTNFCVVVKNKKVKAV
jgi:hypothetical protein